MREVYNKLEQLGMSETIAKIYRALLEKRELSAMEIHELTGVPRTKIYEIAQKMILRGMCIEKRIGRSKKYQAVAPKRLFDILLKESELEHTRKVDLAESLLSTLSPIYELGSQNTDVSDYIEYIKDAPSIHERYTSLMRNAEFEILSFSKPPYAYQNVAKKRKEQEDQQISKLSSGILCKVIYEYKDKSPEDFYLPHIEISIQAGLQVRYLEQLPVKMIVFDRRFVLIAMRNSESTTTPLTMLLVDHPSLASAMSILFNTLWDNGINLEEYKKLNNINIK